MLKLNNHKYKMENFYQCSSFKNKVNISLRIVFIKLFFLVNLKDIFIYIVNYINIDYYHALNTKI